MTTAKRGRQPQSVLGMSARKKGCLGCGGAAVLVFVALAVIGVIGSPKQTTAARAPAAASPRATTASSAPSLTRHGSPGPEQAGESPQRLEHGPQRGFSACVISFKDAQQGAGTSTFSALVLNDSGAPYSPADSDPYSVTYQFTARGTDNTSYSVTEALGSGSRTADNNGPDWFGNNQSGIRVTANATEGMVESTLPVPLAQVKGVQGSISVTNQNDQNNPEQSVCAVRPAQG